MKTVQLSNKRIKEDLLYLYREYEQNIISRQEIIDFSRIVKNRHENGQIMAQ